MNKIFSVVWSARLGQVVVASELTRRRTKGRGITCTLTACAAHGRLLLVTTAAFPLALVASAVYADGAGGGSGGGFGGAGGGGGVNGVGGPASASTSAGSNGSANGNGGAGSSGGANLGGIPGGG